MNAVGLLQKIKKWLPGTCASLAGKKRFRVANKYERVSSPRQENVEPLRSNHETYVSVAVAASQAGDDDIAFFALEVV